MEDFEMDFVSLVAFQSFVFHFLLRGGGRIHPDYRYRMSVSLWVDFSAPQETTRVLVPHCGFQHWKNKGIWVEIFYTKAVNLNLTTTEQV